MTAAALTPDIIVVSDRAQGDLCTSGRTHSAPRPAPPRPMGVQAIYTCEQTPNARIELYERRCPVLVRSWRWAAESVPFSSASNCSALKFTALDESIEMLSYANIPTTCSTIERFNIHEMLRPSFVDGIHR